VFWKRLSRRKENRLELHTKADAEALVRELGDTPSGERLAAALAPSIRGPSSPPRNGIFTPTSWRCCPN